MNKKTIEFGKYPQTDVNGNEKEAINWYVIDLDSKILLLSKYGLDCKSYHNEEVEAVTWATSFIRYWLNHDFFNVAFTSIEQSIIQLTLVTADKNIWYRSNPGNDTYDKVFLLSIQEVEKLFPDDVDRLCMPTEYAVNHGAWRGYEGNCWWWLRSPGFAESFAAFVRSGGGVRDLGADVYYKTGAIRPALYVEKKHFVEYININN